MSCVYCGRKAYYTLKNGKKCCSKSPSSCPKQREKNSLSQLGRKNPWKKGEGFKKGNKPWNLGKRTGPREKISLKKVMVQHSTYARHSLKKRLIAEGIIKYECKICQLGPIWRGKPMMLILDHINGVSDDNRRKNLRFVCSNCDSQLPTYKSKNRK